MHESIIYLENISLVDFLGTNNANFDEIALAFPTTKIISRGNEIRIQGKQKEVNKINEIISALIQHFNKFGHLKPEQVQSYLSDKVQVEVNPAKDILLLSAKGSAIKPNTKSANFC